MDVATAVTGSTNAQNSSRLLSERPDPPPPSAPHHRRHTRYNSSASSEVPPPHVIINTRRRRSPRQSRQIPDMDPSPSPPAVASPSHPAAPPAHITHQSQDHDRMETDEDSDQYVSEAEDSESAPEPTPLANAATATPPPLSEDVDMESTPDPPALSAASIPAERGQDRQDDEGSSLAGLGESVIMEDPTNARGTPPPPVTPIDPIAILPEMPEIPIAAGDAMIESGVLIQELDEAIRPHPLGDRIRRPEDHQDDDDDDDEGSDSDESMDESDYAYWAHFKPDTTEPDEAELAMIQDMQEPSATDHKHWEECTFEPLEDPEYVPGKVGRITWTVKGNHGTPDRPNREEIMRSPSVRIGDLYWNIKYYPHGNDGTDFMSVYIECSSRPYEDSKDQSPAVEAGIVEAAQNVNTNAHEPTAEPGELLEVNARPGAVNNFIDEVGNKKVQLKSAGTDENANSTKITSGKTYSTPEPEPQWAAAAQASCIIYNPNEPRVCVFQKSKHQYYNDNPDWGWTRFHGPWSEIHMRKRNQRKPLLENDTLEFTVYIRIIEDSTKSLWWHPSDSQPNWDSLSLIGLRGLKTRETQSSALIAALSAWVHLGFLKEAILDIDVPERVTCAGQILKPVLREFREILVQEGLQRETPDIRLTPLAMILGFFYGSDIDTKKDAVLIWETLRRILELEASLGDDSGAAARALKDCFGDILMLKQPDPFYANNASQTVSLQPRDIAILPWDYEPASVQEVLDLASQHPVKAFRSWAGSQELDHAQAPFARVLQIELHRQCYSKEARKWKKLTHKIAMDEVVICNTQDYTLYGMIIHRGGLDYNEYYSVLRPDGPGTRWIKYAGDGSSRAVEILTTKQALQDHEGGNDDESAAVAYIAIYLQSDLFTHDQGLTAQKAMLQQKHALREPPIEDDNNSTLARGTSFRIGHRHWCAGADVPQGKVYDLMGDTSHLQRIFYRTGEKRKSDEDDTTWKSLLPSSENGEGESGSPASDPMRVIVKKFDNSTQTLGEPMYIKILRDMPIIQHLRLALGTAEGETWDFYHEHGVSIKSKNLVKRNTKFSDLSYGDNNWDGMLFIAQRHPSKEQIKTLEAAGKCVTPIEHSQHLLGDHNPLFYAPHLTNSYFTHPYLSVPLSHGRPHGQGTHVSLSGSSYTGPFRCGRKAGPHGTMAFANGDTYTGDWLADEPDGQGTMVYAKTGNRYEGGWRKRRRHGRGKMEYKVADEEMMLCGVCYERDMDAVFCYCGHVVACEECARRVEFCPICREPVKRVVVLKGATGGKGGVAQWGGGQEGGGGQGVVA